MNELTIIKRGDTAYIDSRDVAEAIGKLHHHLLRDIRGYCEIIKKGGLTKVGLSDFFVESSYVSPQNRIMPCYLLTKMGCEMVALKLTGEKGVLFTFAYVSRFNELEAAEREAEIQAQCKPRLSEFNGAIRNVLGMMSQAYVSPESVMDFLCDIYKPLGIRVTKDGYTPCFYTVTDIAQINGIYSENGNPHGHAVAAIISRLKINESQMIAVPYGLVGVTYRYDIDVINAVSEWITKNRFPSEIPYLNFNYHVYYGRNVRSGLIKEDFLLALINDSIDYTSDELDAMCVDYDDCDDCPGKYVCCD